MASAAPEALSDAVSSSRRSSEQLEPVCKPVARRHLPRFAIWQAKQLVVIDVIFGIFLLLIYVLYLSKTLPGLCIKGPPPPTDAGYVDLKHAQQWPISWRLLCGHMASDPGSQLLTRSQTAAVTINSTAAPPERMHNWTAMGSITAGVFAGTGSLVRWLLVPVLAAAAVGLQAASLLAQGLMCYFGTGFLSGDPFHVMLPSLRVIALLLPLLPLPLPNISALWRPSTAAASQNPAFGTNSRYSPHVTGSNGTSSVRSSSSSGSSYVWWYRPCYYWQYPHIRQTVAVLQRLVPCIACALCVGHTRSVCFDAAPGIGFWQGLGKYIFQGWVASTLVLPLHLHLTFVVCEWALMYSSTMQVNLYHSTSSSSSSSSDDDGLSGTAWLAPYHLITSLVCVVLLPTAVLMVYHSSSRSRYDMLQATGPAPCTAADAAADDTSPSDTAVKQQQYGKEKQQKQKSGSSSSSRNATLAAAAAPAECVVQPGAPANQFLVDVSSSLQAAAPAAAKTLNCSSSTPDLQTHFSKSFQHHLPTTATTDSSSSNSSSSSSRYPTVLGSQLADNLRLLLADDAAAVFEAAAAAAAIRADGSASSSSSYSYQSQAASLPVSIKVHTDHTDVSLLEPVLNNSLSHQLYNNGWADSSGHLMHPQMMSACFPGCVQLIANVLALKRPPTAAAAAGSSESEGRAGVGVREAAAAALGNSSSSSHKEFAAAVLAEVQVSVSAAGHSHCTADDKAAAAAAAAGALPHSDSQADDTIATAAAAAGDVEGPRVDVAVGSAVVSTAAKPQQISSSSSSSELWLTPVVQVQYCDPVCLTAAREQEVTLHLLLPEDSQQTASTAAAAAAACVRVLVFRHGAVVIDQEVQLTSAIRLLVPAQAPGILQVALLPTAAAAAAALKAAETADDPAVSTQAAVHAPLLLPPLLVLPEEAAQELQQHWQQAAAAAMEEDAACSSAEACSLSWQRSVSGIAADMAFLVPTVTAFRATQATAAAAAAASSGGVPATLPLAVVEVLVHLLQHLATHRMWHIMHYLVGGTAAHASSSSSSRGISSPNIDTSSSSSSSGDVDDVCREKTGTALTPADSMPAATSSSKLQEPGPQKPAAAKYVARALSQGQVADSLSTSVTNMGVMTVSVSELLWGFANPDLEAAYQAVAFSSTGTLDVMAAVDFFAMGLGCCFAQPGQGDGVWIQKLSAPQRQGLGIPDSPAAVGMLNPGAVLLSHVITLTISVLGPVSVLLLRFRVARTLRAAAAAAGAHALLQQQQQPPSKASSSRGKQNATQQDTHMPRQQRQQQAVAAATLAHASSIKRCLLACWVLVVHVWALLVICGSRLICVPPVMIIRAWALAGTAHWLAATVGLALKAWAAQVPFAWLLPLMTLETLVNISGSIKFGSHSWTTLLLQYVPGLIAGVAAGGGQQVWGRKQFCQRHGIEIVGGGVGNRLRPE